MSKLCEACHLKYQECAVRECPLKPGHYICFSCCRKCKRSYEAVIGWGCRAFDRMKSENPVITEVATADA